MPFAEQQPADSCVSTERDMPSQDTATCSALKQPASRPFSPICSMQSAGFNLHIHAVTQAFLEGVYLGISCPKGGTKWRTVVLASIGVICTALAADWAGLVGSLCVAPAT